MLLAQPVLFMTCHPCLAQPEVQAACRWTGEVFLCFVAVGAMLMDMLPLQESRSADYETVSLECSFAHLALDIADAAYIMKQRTLSALAALPESQAGYRLHIFLPDIPFSLHTRVSDIYRRARP